MNHIRYVYADDADTKEKLRAELDREDNVLKTVAVIGDNDLLSKWDAGADCSGFCVEFCVDYEYIKHNYGVKDASLMADREAAVQELFRRWDKAGFNKHHAKTPFVCKTFIEFINIDRYRTKAMYIVFAA
jgi:hypothetical protein